MVRSGGKRSNTRYIHSKPFRKSGNEHVSTYIQNFKIGEYVDILINSSIQKGIPFKYYHGKTGKIFKIAGNSVGVMVEKIVGNRKICKKINIRIEHLRKSKTMEGHKERIKGKDKIRQSLNKKKSFIFFRKVSGLPVGDHFISFEKIIKINPEPYSIII
jgi:large subunit ribosomal protein L21e